MTGSPQESGGTGDKPWAAEDARKRWAELLSTVQYGDRPQEITRNGKRAVVVVSAAWYDKAAAALAAQDRRPTKRA